MHKKCDCNGHGMKHHKEIKKHKPVIVDGNCPTRRKSCDSFDRHDFVDHCPTRKVRKCSRCW